MTERQDINGPYSDKQLQILEVAERLFAERGFEGTSVRDIAHEANVNVAMISYYFGSKEKLLQAMFIYRIAASRLLLEHLLANKEMHPLDKVNAVVETMVERMMQHRMFHRVMLQCQLTTDNESVARLIKETKMQNLELVNRIIAEGQEQKVFVNDVDGGMLMMTIAGTVYQAAAGSAYFKATNPDQTATEGADLELIKKKLKTHLKRILKAVLTYEGK